MAIKHRKKGICERNKAQLILARCTVTQSPCARLLRDFCYVEILTGKCQSSELLRDVFSMPFSGFLVGTPEAPTENVVFSPTK